MACATRPPDLGPSLWNHIATAEINRSHHCRITFAEIKKKKKKKGKINSKTPLFCFAGVWTSPSSEESCKTCFLTKHCQKSISGLLWKLLSCLMHIYSAEGKSVICSCIIWIKLVHKTITINIKFLKLKTVSRSSLWSESSPTVLAAS